MSTVGDVLKSVRSVLLLQSQVEHLEQEIVEQNEELKRVARDLVALDKRVVRIETMIEMGSRQSQTKRIEE